MGHPDSNLDLPDPQTLVTHRWPRPWTEACFLHLEPAADVNPSGERKGEPGRALEPGEGCSRATELFNPTFLHYIGIPYVHFSFLTSHVNTCLPMWGALAGRRMFLYTSRWDRGRPGGFEVLLTPEGCFRRGGGWRLPSLFPRLCSCARRSGPIPHGSQDLCSYSFLSFILSFNRRL